MWPFEPASLSSKTLLESEECGTLPQAQPNADPCQHLPLQVRGLQAWVPCASPGLALQEVIRKPWSKPVTLFWPPQVTFEDVALYFSREEWAELREWQRDLYCAVMMDNYKAVAALGKEGRVCVSPPPPPRENLAHSRTGHRGRREYNWLFFL